jgi:hypothetical protein
MRIKTNQFEYAGNKAAKSEYLGSAWRVFREFEIEEDTEDDVIVYARPRRAKLTEPTTPGVAEIIPMDLLFEDHNLKCTYAPLRDQPDLFLKFAHLSRNASMDKDGAMQVMFDWIGAYGVLGLVGVDEPAAPHACWQREGRRESLYGFVNAVSQAARCLSLYEAAMSPDGPDIEALERLGALDGGARHKKEWALRTVGDHVAEQLKNECYPRLYQESLKKTGETVGFAQGWGSRSLLGVMYLQMAWLITEGHNAPRCKYRDCHRIIRIGEMEQAVTDPGIRKNARAEYRTRKDKEFCSRNCKEKWRYHHIIKPRRLEGGSAST